MDILVSFLRNFFCFRNDFREYESWENGLSEEAQNDGKAYREGGRDPVRHWFDPGVNDRGVGGGDVDLMRESRAI